MIGWFIESKSLVQVIGVSAPMQFNTALGFLLSAIGLGALLLPAKLKYVPIGSAIAIILLSSITAMQTIFSINLGIDTLFVEPFLADRTDYPGRMSSISSICFVLTGVILILNAETYKRPASPATSGLISSVLLAISLTVLLAYFAGLTDTKEWIPFTKMAIHTTIGFLILSIALTLRAISATDQSPHGSNWFKFSVFVSTLGVSVCLSSIIRSSELQRTEQELSRVAENVAIDTRTNIDLGHLAVKRIADDWKASEAKTVAGQQPIWESAIVRSTREFTPLKAIALINDETEIEWIDPPISDDIEDAIKDTDKFIIALAKLTTSMEMAQSCSIALPDPQGFKPSIIICEPIFSGNKKKFIAGLFSPEILFQKVLQEQTRSKFHVSITNAQGVIFKTENTLNDPAKGKIGRAIVPSELAPWTISVSPSASFVSANKSAIPQLSLVFGVLLSLALTSAVYLKEKADRKAVTALRASQDLQKEITLRQTAEIAVLEANSVLEEKVAQQVSQLEESSNKLRLAISGSGVGTWHYDLEEEVIEFSERAKELFGLSPSDEISYPIFQSLLHEEDRERVSKEVAEAIQEGTEYDIEYQVEWPNGETHWIAAKGQAFYSSDGNAVRMEGIVLDIDERKEAQAKLEQLHDDMGTMLYVLSHDLKEPVRSIVNFSEIIAEDYSESLCETSQEYLKRLHRAGTRLNLLLEDVLQLAKTRSMPEPSDLIELKEIVLDVIEQNNASIEETGASINVEDELPAVIASPQWATQAVHNLVSNALKFSSASGPPHIEIKAFNGRTEAGIIVEDNGPGVPPEISTKIFQLFQRGVDRDVQGTGVGLAIVKQVAERHGGHAWCEPREVEGTRMILTFSKKSRLDFSNKGTAPRESKPQLSTVISEVQ
ncbi:MAG: PAS domain-containing sensor histidine kinase [Verrucomicrobiales bacterium]|nr:PAS domain-containing sensor histidine kinase [Verrucomicrobiales bacterium]